MASSSTDAPPTQPMACVSRESGSLVLRLGADPSSAWVQGSMRIRQPLYIDHEYLRRMLGGLLWMPGAGAPQGVALHLGLGAGCLARFTRHALGMATIGLDLNPHVIEACRRHFGLEPDERLGLVHAEGRSWLHEHARGADVRLLFVDMYDQDAAPPADGDADFYRDCRLALRRDGVAAFSLLPGRCEVEPSVEAITQAFGASQVWRFEPTEQGHVVVLAGRALAWPDADERRRRALAVDRRFHTLGLKAGSWPRLLHRAGEPVSG